MENSPGKAKKTSYARSIVKYLLLIVGAYALYVVAYNIYAYRERRSMERAVVQQAQSLQALQRQEDEMRIRDTQGGATPQETLALYIQALEKGDYEMASKYFVWWEQEKEKKSLDKNASSTISNYIKMLKGSLSAGGTASWDGNAFVYERPIYVNLIRYEQNGVWKIASI